MKKIILFFQAIFCVFALAARQKIIPTITQVTHKLGDDRARIKIYKYGPQEDVVFINLHSDEITSVSATKKILEKRGGLLITLENDNKRNVRFRLNQRLYTFDPNRIFSKAGIRKSLAGFKHTSQSAVNEVEKFAARLLNLLPKHSHCVIALHNNTNGNLSVKSFLPGSKYATDAKRVYADEDQDRDDFFLTTDSLLFHQLSAEKYNAVWQDNLRVQQDGSLSVYAGEKNICYLNCETEHGKTKQYEEMINAALKYIDQRKNTK